MITAQEARARTNKRVRSFELVLQKIEQDIKYAISHRKAFCVQTKIPALHLDSLRDYIQKCGYGFQMNGAIDKVYDTVYITISW